MEFLIPKEKEIKAIVSDINYNDLKEFINFIEANNIADLSKHKLKLHSIRKIILVDIITGYFMNLDFRDRLYKYIIQDKQYIKIYNDLIWKDKYIHLDDTKLDLKLPTPSSYNVISQKIGLLTRQTRFTYNKELEYDILELNKNLKQLLKLIVPIPDDYHIKAISTIKKSEFTYNNEDNILDFINIMDNMLDNNLVSFSKNSEKPLAKTLNILKASTNIDEFYSIKKLNTLATDMLTRSFYFYYKQDKSTKDPLTRLKNFVELQLKNRVSFTVSKLFTSHLKKVKFGYYVDEERELFNIIKEYIKIMPKDEWVSIDNILQYSAYRDMAFYYESSSKTQEYFLETDEYSLYVNNYYEDIFFNPIIKAMFFYLASLGLIELQYDTPLSPINKSAKGVDYISVWDGLRYIKFTSLGRYIFGFSKTYTPKEIKQTKNKLKFDEYKPIITVEPTDVISLAKLEQFAEKYDTNRYILSYNKIFKDCKSYKMVNIKIDNFYKQIEANPPQVFKTFFDSIKDRANRLKRDLKQVVIELDNNSELLNLFMSNKKLQELIIKAQGYRVIVEKNNIPKLTKIVKDNGFFVDF